MLGPRLRHRLPRPAGDAEAGGDAHGLAAAAGDALGLVAAFADSYGF